MSLTPTTKLEAVNEILSSIGESPVNTLNSGVVDAELAATVLESVSRRFQANGWSFNKEESYPLLPSTEGEVYLPYNVLTVDQVIGEGNSFTMRGKRMYDKVKHTFNIGKTLNCDIVVLLDFEDLPSPAREYVSLKAARSFQDKTVGAADLHGYQREDEEKAWYEFLATEVEQADYNIFGNTQIQHRINRRV